MMKRKTAQVLIAIPLILFVAAIISVMVFFFLAGAEEDLQSFLFMAGMGLLIPVFAPLPCLLMSVIGTIAASKAIRAGQFESKGVFYLGVVEIITSICCSILSVYLFYCIAGGA